MFQVDNHLKTFLFEEFLANDLQVDQSLCFQRKDALSNQDNLKNRFFLKDLFLVIVLPNQSRLYPNSWESSASSQECFGIPNFNFSLQMVFFQQAFDI